MMTQRALWALPILLMLAGCGGGSNGPLPDKATLFGQIAYSQNEGFSTVPGGPVDNVRSDIYLARAGGTTRARVTPPTLGTFNEAPAISPDGQSIAFVSSGDNGQARDIYTIATDGSDLRRVTADGNAIEESAPRWTRDGKRLLFYSSPSVNGTLVEFKIYSVSAQGGTPQVLLRGDGGIFGFDLSPDGRNVAYGAYNPSDGSSRIVLRALSGTSEPRTLPGSYDELSFAFSPDGRRLALTFRQPDGTVPGRASFALAVMNVDGTNVRTVIEGLNRSGGVSWSPNGVYLAYGSNQGSIVPPNLDAINGTIYIVRADGSSAPRVLGLQGARGGQFSPSWSR